MNALLATIVSTYLAVGLGLALVSVDAFPDQEALDGSRSPVWLVILVSAALWPYCWWVAIRSSRD